LSIGRRYSAELHVVIDWVVARSGWITLTLVPLIGLIIIVAVRSNDHNLWMALGLVT
jgi:hypothetical protein